MLTSMLAVSPVEALVAGQLTSVDVEQLELESSRRALRLLRERLTAEQMESLLADDLVATDNQWREWAQASDGSWRAAEVEFLVSGLSTQDFRSWWSTALNDLHGVVYPAFPEHYRFGWVQNPSGGEEPCYVVIEELGHVPFRMYCSFGPAWAPVDVAQGYELDMVGVGRLQDGTQVVRFMNQIKDTADGLAMKVGVYLVSATPDYVVQSHVEQELVEWTRWLQMAVRQREGE